MHTELVREIEEVGEEVGAHGIGDDLAPLPLRHHEARFLKPLRVPPDRGDVKGDTAGNVEVTFGVPEELEQNAKTGG